MHKKLTAADRGAIEVLLRKKYTFSHIAKELHVHRSTVCREVNNRSTPAGYFADIAQLNYEEKKNNSRRKSKIRNSAIRNYIFNHLQRGWSPEQISGRMKYEQHDFCVSHETIYQFIYGDEYCFKEKWYQYLRYGRKKRRKQTGRSVNRYKAPNIPNRTSIHDRSEIVAKHSQFGHWEGDSVIYPNKYAINTLNELKTGIVVFTKLKRRTAVLTAKAMSRQLKGENPLTLTLDNGSEFTNHEDVSDETGVQVFFCDPYSSWQRGSNENVNSLLRGYLPRRANINDLTQEELDDIAWELNNRPRKRLGYRTPLEVYAEEVYSLVNS